MTGKWEREVLPIIKEQLQDFEQQGIEPTLRGMFYTLVNLRVLPKLQGKYKQLSDFTARCREDGRLPIDCFADHTRRISQEFDDKYETIGEYLGRAIIHLQSAQYLYVKSIPRWYKQPHHVELWVEKDAVVENFNSLLKGKDVRVISNRGWSSISFMNENIQRLVSKQNGVDDGVEKKIHIRYFGDLDPSGIKMDKTYAENIFPKYRLYNVDFRRLAVTVEQTNRFHLIHNPDPGTMKKLLHIDKTMESRRKIIPVAIVVLMAFLLAPQL